MRLHKGDDAAVIVHRKRRVIWLQGEIVDGISRSVRKSLNLLNRDSDETIWFYMCSQGGSVNEESPIINAINSSRAPVIMIGFREVCSAALVIFQSGRCRYAVPYTKIGFHQARTYLNVCRKHHGLMIGAADCLKIFHELKRVETYAVCEFSRHMKLNQVESLLSREADISVARAIRLGMIDGYFDQKEFRCDLRAISRVYNDEENLRP